MAMVLYAIKFILKDYTLTFFLYFSLFRLFIIEGVPSVILAGFSAWYLPNKPETATFLKHDEREFAIARLASGKLHLLEIL
jgi:hypothetical protein